jgi:hypothetical protein
MAWLGPDPQGYGPVFRLRADYTLTWQEGFRDTCKEICRTSERLRILYMVDHGVLPPNNGLPSWACDRYHFTTLRVGFLYRKQAACGNTRPQLGSIRTEDPNVLIAKGLVADEMMAVTQPSSLSKSCAKPSRLVGVWTPMP